MTTQTDPQQTDQALRALYALALPEARGRLSRKRFEHSISVVSVAEDMAIAYGVAVWPAKLAALLHDWDKDLPEDQLIWLAIEYGITVPASPEKLLHALTGAKSAARQFNELPDEVVQAIERHTLAAPQMSDLDMVIYVADLIEPLRGTVNTSQLRSLIGKLPLMVLFRDALQTTFDYLEERQRPIHLQSLAAMSDINARIHVLGLED